MNKLKERGKSTILSGYVTDTDTICNSIGVKDHGITHISDLDCMTEEADCRLTLHIAKTGEEHFKIILVHSNDTVVVIFNEQFKSVNIEDMDKISCPRQHKNIPTHRIADILGVDKSSVEGPYFDRKGRD